MAEYLANLTSGQIDEKGIFRLIGTLFTQSGVVQSGALAVSAQGTPDMTVKVAGAATGHDIVFINSSGDTYHGWNTANKNVTITSNASGVTKTDAIVAYADLAAGISTSNNPGALKFVAVRRSGSNTGNPTSTEIQTAVGASNPYVVLAYVTVANGASSINSGNITDARVRAQIEKDNLEALTGANVSVSSAANALVSPYVTAVPKLATGNQETGACGLRFYSYDTTARIFDYQVNFKTVMTNVPSSITLTPGNTNNLFGGVPSAAGISLYGFRFSITSNNATGDTRAIDFTYTTVGN